MAINKNAFPVVDNGRCTLCLGCLEVAPEVFYHNSSLDIIEVRDLKDYRNKGVLEAMKLCPADCIEWSE